MPYNSQIIKTQDMQNKNDKFQEKGRDGKGNPFSVPENYFESFPRKLRQRLQNEKQGGLSYPEKAWTLIKPQIALAAAIAGFAIIGYLGFHNFISQEEEWLTNEGITEYIDLYEHEFSDYYLLTTLDDDFFADEESYFDEMLYTDDPETYIDYLYHDDVDLDLILTEY